MDGILAEANLIERSLVATQYGVEPYPVRSEAHSSLRNLSMALGPTGITIYQERNRLEIFKWNEIWNAGYVEKTFWIRIFREGENSRHKHTLSSSRLCKEVNICSFSLSDTKRSILLLSYQPTPSQAIPLTVKVASTNMAGSNDTWPNMASNNNACLSSWEKKIPLNKFSCQGETLSSSQRNNMC